MTDKVSTKDLQKNLVDQMKAWQKIETASVDSTGQIMEQTDNLLIKMIMEIIQSDSKLHYKVQSLITDTLEKAPIPLSTDELSSIWDSIEVHIKYEKQMVSLVQNALAQVKGRGMMVQEYLLNYLLRDEEKHDALLDALEQVKRGVTPYGA